MWCITITPVVGKLHLPTHHIGHGGSMVVGGQCGTTDRSFWIHLKLVSKETPQHTTVTDSFWQPSTLL